jgi:hypothetical protein
MAFSPSCHNLVAALFLYVGIPTAPRTALAGPAEHESKRTPTTDDDNNMYNNTPAKSTTRTTVITIPARQPRHFQEHRLIIPPQFFATPSLHVISALVSASPSFTPSRQRFALWPLAPFKTNDNNDNNNNDSNDNNNNNDNNNDKNNNNSSQGFPFFFPPFFLFLFFFFSFFFFT